MPTAWTFLWRHQLESRCWWELHQIAQLQTQIATIAAWIHLVIGMATVALSKARQKVKDSRFQTYRLPLHTGFMIPAKVDLGVLQWGRLHCVVLSLPAPGRLTTSELRSFFSGLSAVCHCCWQLFFTSVASPVWLIKLIENISENDIL